MEKNLSLEHEEFSDSKEVLDFLLEWMRINFGNSAEDVFKATVRISI